MVSKIFDFKGIQSAIFSHFNFKNHTKHFFEYGLTRADQRLKDENIQLNNYKSYTDLFQKFREFVRTAEKSKISTGEIRSFNQYILVNKRPTLEDKNRVAKWIIEDSDPSALENWTKKFMEFPLMTDFCEIRWGSVFTMIENFLKGCLKHII